MSPLPNPVTNKVILKNYNTPATIAGVAPSLDYRFALDKTEIDAVSLTDKLTFSRSATCAFTDSGGNLALAGANVPRFIHDSTTKESLGLLRESGSTNLIRRSTEFNVSPWTTSGVIVTPNSAIAPDGTLTAESLQSTSSNGYIQQTRVTTVATNTTRVFSVYLRADTSVSLSVQMSLTEYFNFGSITTRSMTANVTTEWQRFSLTYSVPGNQFGGGSRFITPRIGGSNSFTTGEKVYAWGFQDEGGSTATSFIRTEGSSVSRVETALIDGTGVLTGNYTLVEDPVGCASVSGSDIVINLGYIAKRVMVFPVSLTSEQITAIRSVM